ncbi:MAG: RagB/SusD family nutrient uptake outer membrane protein [Bacteroidales bacterium]
MKYIKYLLIVTFLLVIVSCDEDKYLDIYPKTSITQDEFYNTVIELNQGLNDAYRQLGRVYNAHGIVDLYGEQSSDNTYILIKGGGDNFSEQIAEHRIIPNNNRIVTAWNVCYNAIYICNLIIEKLETTTTDIDQGLKNRMIAEAKAIRSLIYFNMVRVWGDIPLVLIPISPIAAYDYLREDSEKVYAQIISDLNSAKNNLPGNYTGVDVGRITRYGVSGILSKVYLTLGDKQAAQSELSDVINSGMYSLDANNDGVVNSEDFSYIFAPGIKNTRSSVLEIQYLAGANANNSNHMQSFTPFHWAFHLGDIGGPTTPWRGEGINTPTTDLIESFEDGDPRQGATYYPGYTDQEAGEFVNYPWTIKYFDPNFSNPGSNVPVIRYADILLMYAEVTEDATYLNMVRDRAGLPRFGSDEYPTDLYPTLERAIEHERRVELAFEFHRFFDLVRTGRAVEVLQAKGYNLNVNNLLFPIPQSVIDVNSAITQNPGY